MKWIRKAFGAFGIIAIHTVSYTNYSKVAFTADAQAGRGNFLDTNANSTGNLFSISDLVIVPGEVCE